MCLFVCELYVCCTVNCFVMYTYVQARANGSVSKYEVIFDEYINLLCFFAPLKDTWIILCHSNNLYFNLYYVDKHS